MFARRALGTVVGGALVCALVLYNARATEVPPTCTTPDSLLELTGGLRQTIALIRQSRPVRVLAIGSSSTQGVGASSPARAYPAQLELELRERFPGTEFSVTNAGIGGEIAAETLVRLRAAVREASPDLVIWQVGTNDAVRDVHPATFANHLREGIHLVAGKGVDLILMDQQYTPQAKDPDRYDDYVDAVAHAAKENGIPLLRRFEVMEHWAELRPAPPAVLSGDRFHMNDLGYSCIAEILAEGIERRALAGR